MKQRVNLAVMVPVAPLQKLVLQHFPEQDVRLNRRVYVSHVCFTFGQ